MDRHPLSSSPPSSSPSPLSFSSSWAYEDNEQFDRARGGYPREEKTKANLYKTELCRSFEETRSCKYGGKCQFAHGKEELRVTNRHPRFKTEICKTFHTTGTCPYGIRCRFIHMNGIPKCWEASYPLNYLILHEDRGSQELPSVSQLDGFLKQLLDILEGVNYDPEYAPEYAYLAKFMLHGTPILGRDDLVNIHQQVAASYPKYRLPIFESVASKTSENRFGVSSLFGPHYRDEVGRKGTTNQTTA